MYFEYAENNNEVVIGDGTIIFSNYVEKGLKSALCPVPKAYIWGQVMRPENELHIGLNDVLYEVSFFHNGFIMNIEECEKLTLKGKIMEKKLVNEAYLISKGFEVEGDTLGTGWSYFRKNNFEVKKMPLQKGGHTFGFAFECNSQTKYKYPLTISELENLYKILTGKEL